MTNDDTITLGDYCEGLLQEEFFKVVVQQFEAQCFLHFIQTDPKNVKEREAIYARLNGFNDFRLHALAIVQQRDALLAKLEAPSPDDEDAPDEDID